VTSNGACAKTHLLPECDGSGGSIGHGGMTEALSLDSGRICRRDFRGRFSKVKVLYFYGGVCAGLRA